MTDPFARATFDLLMVMQDRQLPAPLSLTWSQYTHELGVQVPPGSFLRWLDSMTYAERSTSRHGGLRHHRANGHLRGAPEVKVRLTAVTAEFPAVA